MRIIKWGLIGCGDVTEIKSGPAFNKVPNSKLVAVMRRDEEKVKDYAARHNVAKWYTNAEKLINDPEVDAVYIATPPLQHMQYTIAALKANKPVYVEKPMALDYEAAKKMAEAAKDHKVSVAHYRRAQPMFSKLKEFLDSDIIGEIRFVDLKFYQPALTAAELLQPEVQWRVNPAVSGGGLFHDLAPHQIDLMLYFFGDVKDASGFANNQAKNYDADDIVAGNIVFENGVIFQGMWCFNVPTSEAKDECVIVGSKGKISFSVFGEPKILITKNDKTSIVLFQKLEHVQQPMIEKVVNYFLDEGENPCSAEAGAEVMRIMNVFTKK